MKILRLLVLGCCLFVGTTDAVAQDDEPRFPGCSDPTDFDCADMKLMQFGFSNVKHPEGNPGGEVVVLFTVKASDKLPILLLLKV